MRDEETGVAAGDDVDMADGLENGAGDDEVPGSDSCMDMPSSGHIRQDDTDEKVGQAEAEAGPDSSNSLDQIEIKKEPMDDGDSLQHTRDQNYDSDNNNDSESLSRGQLGGEREVPGGNEFSEEDDELTPQLLCKVETCLDRDSVSPPDFTIPTVGRGSRGRGVRGRPRGSRGVSRGGERTKRGRGGVGRGVNGERATVKRPRGTRGRPCTRAIEPAGDRLGSLSKRAAAARTAAAILDTAEHEMSDEDESKVAQVKKEIKSEVSTTPKRRGRPKKPGSPMKPKNSTPKIRRWDRVKPLKCEICLLPFARESSLLSHLNIQHSLKVSKKCDKCETSFEDGRDFFKHKQLCYGTHVVCDFCARNILKSNYLAHQKKHVKNDIPETTTPPSNKQKEFICEICSKTINSKASLEHHMQIHQQIKTLQCPHCDRRFRHDSGFRAHIQSAHTPDDARPFHCKFCDRRFKDRSNLRNHEYTHSNQKPFECPKCQQGFIRKDMCRNHMEKCGQQQPQPQHHHTSAFNNNKILGLGGGGGDSSPASNSSADLVHSHHHLQKTAAVKLTGSGVSTASAVKAPSSPVPAASASAAALPLLSNLQQHQHQMTSHHQQSQHQRLVHHAEDLVTKTSPSPPPCMASAATALHQAVMALTSAAANNSDSNSGSGGMADNSAAPTSAGAGSHQSNGGPIAHPLLQVPPTPASPSVSNGPSYPTPSPSPAHQQPQQQQYHHHNNHHNTVAAHHHMAAAAAANHHFAHFQAPHHHPHHHLSFGGHAAAGMMPSAALQAAYSHYGAFFGGAAHHQMANSHVTNAAAAHHSAHSGHSSYSGL